MKHLGTIAGLIVVGLEVPASAMSFQPAPRNGDGSSQLVDPDEQTDRLTDQMRRNDQRLFARGELSSSGMVETRDDRAATPMNAAAPLPLGAPR